MKMIVIIRSDLKMGKGKIAGQVGHACTSLLYNNPGSDNIKKWMEEFNQTKVVLKVDSEEKLLDIINELEKMEIIHYAIRDAGKTQIDPNTLTCVGIMPTSSKKLDALTGDLKLL